MEISKYPIGFRSLGFRGLGFRVLGFRVEGLGFRGHIGIMEKKMETTTTI